MNILVTGSNGFIGSNIIKGLKEACYIIGCGTRENSLIEVDEYVRWDIANESCPSELYDRGIDLIIHAAASLERDDRREEIITTNCLGTHRIYTLARRKHVKKVMYLSGIPIVGIPVHIPVKEACELRPITMYHAAKAAGEYILNQLEKEGIPIVNLRIPSPIGPGMAKKTIVPSFLEKALLGRDIPLLGRGTRRQNYIDVRDIAGAVRKIIESDVPGGTYNLASDETVSNVELARMCIEVTHSRSDICFSPQPDPCDDWVWDVDTSKLKRAIGLFTRYSIRDSLKDIADEMKKQMGTEA